MLQTRLPPPRKPTTPLGAGHCSTLISPAAAYAFHCTASAVVNTDTTTLFAHLDDQQRLSGHMSKSSWMMLGSKMDIALDEDQGRRVGAHIRLSGRVLGVPISVDEVVTERVAPRRKTWQTVGAPRLLVIGPYQMGFSIEPGSIETGAAGATLCVFIDYNFPAKAQWLARILGPMYARWCVNQILRDAVQHFAGGYDA